MTITYDTFCDRALLKDHDWSVSCEITGCPVLGWGDEPVVYIGTRAIESCTRWCRLAGTHTKVKVALKVAEHAVGADSNSILFAEKVLGQKIGDCDFIKFKQAAMCKLVQGAADYIQHLVPTNVYVTAEEQLAMTFPHYEVGLLPATCEKYLSKFWETARNYDRLAAQDILQCANAGPVANGAVKTAENLIHPLPYTYFILKFCVGNQHDNKYRPDWRTWSKFSAQVYQNLHSTNYIVTSLVDTILLTLMMYRKKSSDSVSKKSDSNKSVQAELLEYIRCARAVKGRSNSMKFNSIKKALNSLIVTKARELCAFFLPTQDVNISLRALFKWLVQDEVVLTCLRLSHDHLLYITSLAEQEDFFYQAVDVWSVGKIIHTRLNAILGGLAVKRTIYQKRWRASITGLISVWSGAEVFTPIKTGVASAPMIINDKSQFASTPTVKILHVRCFKDIRKLKDIFPAISETDNRHMTTHLSDIVQRMCEADQSRTQGANKAHVNQLLRRVAVGTNEILVTLLLLRLHSVNDVSDNELATSLHANVVDIGIALVHDGHKMALFKDMSLLARKCSAGPVDVLLPEKTAQGLAYLELAFGRSVFNSNWEAEKTNRTNHTTHIGMPLYTGARMVGAINDKFDESWLDEINIYKRQSSFKQEMFYSQLQKQLDVILAQLLQHINVKESLPEFFQRRQEWLASGSASGHKVQVVAKGQKTTVTGNKRAWAESISLGDVMVKLNSKPKEVATTSEKWENGKARALYGVEPYHYLINTYATKGCEEALHYVDGLEKGVSGMPAINLERYRAYITSQVGLECTMLDFADFNRHHTSQAQAMIFTTLANIGRRLGAHEDWIKCNEWVAGSKYHMYANFIGIPGQYKVNQGMFSGTKSTDFINTILNLAYFRVANEEVRKNFNIQAQQLYHVHQGDDVWISNSNKLWARLLFYTMNNMGFVFQESKQMFGRGRGEYLRVLYAQGTANGYINRALVNYILRPIQNDVTTDVVEWIHTIADGVATLQRRGLNKAAASILWEAGMNQWAKVKLHSKDDAGFRFPPYLIEAQTMQNGFGRARPETLAYSSRQFPKWAPPNVDIDNYLANLPKKMSEDWVKFVSRKGYDIILEKGGLRSEDLIRRSLAANYLDMLRPFIRDKKLKAYLHQFRRDLDKTRHCIQKIAYGEQNWVNEVRSALGSKKLLIIENCNNAERIVEAELICNRYAHPQMKVVGTPEVRLNKTLSFYHQQPKMQSQDFFTLGDDIQRLLASSTFKSVEATMTALGLTKREAVKLIASKPSTAGLQVNEARVALLEAVAVMSDVWLELLTGGSIGNEQVYTQFCNSGVANHVRNIAIERTLVQQRIVGGIPDILAYAFRTEYSCRTMQVYLQCDQSPTAVKY